MNEGSAWFDEHAIEGWNAPPVDGSRCLSCPTTKLYRGAIVMELASYPYVDFILVDKVQEARLRTDFTFGPVRSRCTLKLCSAFVPLTRDGKAESESANRPVLLLSLRIQSLFWIGAARPRMTMAPFQAQPFPSVGGRCCSPVHGLNDP